MQTLEKSPATPAIELWDSRRALALSLFALALLCLALFFFRLGGWALFDPDEARYAEIPRAMLAAGDWVTPRSNGVKFFDKPPLLYWLGALAFRIFGLNEFAARFPSALAATLAVFGAYFLGRKMFGARAGFLGAAILATTVGWPILGRFVLTDMLVSSLVFLALAFWWIGRAQTEKTARFRAFFGFWTALALGILAKGPVAVILTFGVIGTYVVLTRDWAALRKIGWVGGISWAFAIAAPWFFVVQSRNPEYFKAFWIDQNFGRFLGQLAQQDHANGPFYFFEWMPGLLFPWTFFAFPALFVGAKKVLAARGPQRSQRWRAGVFLICGTLVPPLFFSASSSKLVTYIFAIVPLMSIALGAYFDSIWTQTRLRAPRFAALFLSVLLAIFGVAGLLLGPRELQKIGGSPLDVYFTATALLLWAAALSWSALRLDSRALFAATALGFTLFFTIATGLVSAIAPQLTTPSLLQIIQPGLDRGGELVSLNFTQSLSFYAARRVAMVNSPDELRAGLSNLSSQEKARWFMKTEADLKPYFGRKTPVYLVIRSSPQKSVAEMQKIDALGGDFAPVARNMRFTILGNGAARRITPALSE